jgi:hypothetical protein
MAGGDDTTRPISQFIIFFLAFFLLEVLRKLQFLLPK